MYLAVVHFESSPNTALIFSVTLHEINAERNVFVLGVFLSVVSFMHKSLWVTPTNTSETWLVLQVCMETQRFERLMEYFKNEDNNIDFMVCSHTHAQTHTQTHTHAPNGLSITLQPLETPKSPSTHGL